MKWTENEIVSSLSTSVSAFESIKGSRFSKKENERITKIAFWMIGKEKELFTIEEEEHMLQLYNDRKSQV